MAQLHEGRARRLPDTVPIWDHTIAICIAEPTVLAESTRCFTSGQGKNPTPSSFLKMKLLLLLLREMAPYLFCSAFQADHMMY